MAKIYDTGDITLNDDSVGDDRIDQYYWSDLEEVTLNDYAAKIVKIVVEFLDCTAVGGTLCIFSETNSGWTNNADSGGVIAQDPYGTTGQMLALACDAVYEVYDTAFYVANNDSTAVKKLYVAYYNTNADDCQLIVRILYESLALG